LSERTIQRVESGYNIDPQTEDILVESLVGMGIERSEAESIRKTVNPPETRQ
jgi:hypothetical protein